MTIDAALAIIGTPASVFGSAGSATYCFYPLGLSVTSMYDVTDMSKPARVTEVRWSLGRYNPVFDEAYRRNRVQVEAINLCLPRSGR
jgi:hypothetical protein